MDDPTRTWPKLPKKLKPRRRGLRASRARAATWAATSSARAEKPYRARFRTGIFTAMGIIEPLSRGLLLADLVALIASFDVVAPEIDR